MVTNNVAEYRAVISALEKALGTGAAKVRVYLDSELVVRQLCGEYRYGKRTSRPCITRPRRFCVVLLNIVFINIPREQNRRAGPIG